MNINTLEDYQHLLRSHNIENEDTFDYIGDQIESLS